MNEWDYWFEFDFQLLPYFCEWYCKKLVKDETVRGEE